MWGQKILFLSQRIKLVFDTRRAAWLAAASPVFRVLKLKSLEMKSCLPSVFPFALIVKQVLGALITALNWYWGDHETLSLSYLRVAFRGPHPSSPPEWLQYFPPFCSLSPDLCPMGTVRKGFTDFWRKWFVTVSRFWRHLAMSKGCRESFDWTLNHLRDVPIKEEMLM